MMCGNQTHLIIIMSRVNIFCSKQLTHCSTHKANVPVLDRHWIIFLIRRNSACLLLNHVGSLLLVIIFTSFDSFFRISFIYSIFWIYSERDFMFKIGTVERQIHFWCTHNSISSKAQGINKLHIHCKVVLCLRFETRQKRGTKDRRNGF